MICKIDQQKAIEATGVLLRLTKYRKMDRKRLLALLFLAERENLKRTGRPMFGGRISALRHGPIHSEIYSLIAGSGHNQREWSRHFKNDDYRVQLSNENIGVSTLSKPEVDLLNEISAKFAGLGTWDVAMETHTEEYEKNYETGTSTTIPFADMIEGVNRSGDKDAIMQDLQDKAEFDAFFRSNP